MWVRSGLRGLWVKCEEPRLSPRLSFCCLCSILAGGGELLGNGDVLWNVGDTWDWGLTGFWGWAKGVQQRQTAKARFRRRNGMGREAGFSAAPVEMTDFWWDEGQQAKTTTEADPLRG